MPPVKSKSNWERWKDLAARAATFQARVLLAVFYWLVITPFALLAQAFGDPLGLRSRGRWQRPPETDPRRQY